MLSEEPCPSLQHRAAVQTPNELQLHWRAAFRGCKFIKNHFTNLVLSLNLSSQILMGSVAVFDFKLLSCRKMLTAFFLIHEGSCNAILETFNLGQKYSPKFNTSLIKEFSAAFRKATLSEKHFYYLEWSLKVFKWHYTVVIARESFITFQTSPSPLYIYFWLKKTGMTNLDHQDLELTALNPSTSNRSCFR